MVLGRVPRKQGLKPAGDRCYAINGNIATSEKTRQGLKQLFECASSPRTLPAGCHAHLPDIVDHPPYLTSLDRYSFRHYTIVVTLFSLPHSRATKPISQLSLKSWTVSLRESNQFPKYGIDFYDTPIKCIDMTLPDARIASGWKDEGDELFEKGDFEGAVRCYDQVLELFPRDPEIWTLKGLALSELKRYDEAIKSYDTALAYYPRETYVWINKGVALNKVGKQIEAIRCFDIALDIDPQDADALCQKGVSFGLLKWLEEALECFETAIRIDPRHATAWYNKGITLSKLKRENEARYALDRAKELGYS